MKGIKRKFVGLNLPEKIFVEVKREADEQHRSLSSQIVFILENWIDAKNKINVIK